MIVILLIGIVVWAALALFGGGTKNWYEWGMTPSRKWNEDEKI